MTESIQGKQYEDIAKKEAQADGPVTPGEGLTYSGTDPLTVTAGAAETVRIAMEAGLPPIGSDDTDPIDDDYADGDNVHYRVGRPGDTFDNAIAGEAGIAPGDHLVFNADGELVAVAAGDEADAVAVALEPADASDRFEVEVI